MTKQLWTKEEEDRLVMMAAQGKTNRQIADALRRTERAVAHKRTKLGNKWAELNKSTGSGLFEGTKDAERRTEEPEDDTGDGSTELERQIRFQASVIDTLSNELKAYREQVESNLATVLERTNELSQRQTILEDEVAELKKRTDHIAENVSLINIYLNLGPLYRLFHSFRRFAEAHRED